MSKLTIKSGKSELHLRKSSTLVGLKKTTDKGKDDPEYVDKEVFKNLGGFNVVALKKDGGDIDSKLDG